MNVTDELIIFFGCGRHELEAALAGTAEMEFGEALEETVRTMRGTMGLFLVLQSLYLPLTFSLSQVSSDKSSIGQHQDFSTLQKN